MSGAIIQCEIQIDKEVTPILHGISNEPSNKYGSSFPGLQSQSVIRYTNLSITLGHELLGCSRHSHCPSQIPMACDISVHISKFLAASACDLESSLWPLEPTLPACKKWWKYKVPKISYVPYKQEFTMTSEKLMNKYFISLMSLDGITWRCCLIQSPRILQLDQTSFIHCDN